MRVLISGSSGLVGRALSERLESEGARPIALRRATDRPTPESDMWEPIRRESWNRDIGAVDTVVHLAGENIAARRWSPKQKKRIHDSRVIGTKQLCDFLADHKPRPRTIIAASATGYYGDRGDEILTEDSPSGSGFLAEVCREWEAVCKSAHRAGIRVVNLRIGMVLAREGGALKKLLPIFKAGLGGKLGSGRQYMSWITLEDLVRVILHAIRFERISGPVNAVAPSPVTNLEFTKTLGQALHRPAVLPVPNFALRLVAGEMADALLLASTRAEPRRLLDAHFSFRHPDLKSALAALL